MHIIYCLGYIYVHLRLHGRQLEQSPERRPVRSVDARRRTRLDPDLVVDAQFDGSEKYARVDRLAARRRVTGVFPVVGNYFRSYGRPPTQHQSLFDDAAGGRTERQVRVDGVHSRCVDGQGAVRWLIDEAFAQKTRVRRVRPLSYRNSGGVAGVCCQQRQLQQLRLGPTMEQ